jgi:hypothetical protein
MLGPKSIGMRNTIKSTINGEELAELLSPKKAQDIMHASMPIGSFKGALNQFSTLEPSKWVLLLTLVC